MLSGSLKPFTAVPRIRVRLQFMLSCWTHLGCPFPQPLAQCTATTIFLQDKVLRTLVLSCLCQLCTTYLYRLQGPMARDKVSRWLHKTMKPVLLNLRKGNLQAPEQHVSHVGS